MAQKGKKKQTCGMNQNAQPTCVFSSHKTQPKKPSWITSFHARSLRVSGFVTGRTADASFVINTITDSTTRAKYTQRKILIAPISNTPSQSSPAVQLGRHWAGYWGPAVNAVPAGRGGCGHDGRQVTDGRQSVGADCYGFSSCLRWCLLGLRQFWHLGQLRPVNQVSVGHQVTPGDLTVSGTLNRHALRKRDFFFAAYHFQNKRRRHTDGLSQCQSTPVSQISPSF